MRPKTQNLSSSSNFIWWRFFLLRFGAVQRVNWPLTSCSSFLPQNWNYLLRHFSLAQTALHNSMLISKRVWRQQQRRSLRVESLVRDRFAELTSYTNKNTLAASLMHVTVTDMVLIDVWYFFHELSILINIIEKRFFRRSRYAAVSRSGSYANRASHITCRPNQCVPMFEVEDKTPIDSKRLKSKTCF